MTSEKMLKRFLLLLYDFRKRSTLNRKIKSIQSRNGQSGVANTIPKEVKDNHIRLWRHFDRRPRLSWLTLYCNTSGITDYRYVPEPVYYNHIEPCLNNKAFSKGFTDKNFYFRLPAIFNIPETVLSNIEGVWYDGSLKLVLASDADSIIKSFSRLIVKPAVDTGGGRGVAYAGSEHTPLDSAAGLIESYSRNFIVQKAVDGHSFYKNLCNTSLNTLRILTYRSVEGENINILWTLLRVGKTGSITDNQASGGYACGVDLNGNLTGKAVDKWGGTHNNVNGISLIVGTTLPGFDKMITLAKEVAACFPYARLLGLDLCLDSDGEVRVIEINNVNNEINFFQMLYGPLFREYTDEIVEWCRKARRSFIIDYEI